MVPESPLESTEHGLVPQGEGWFVLNMREARWRHAKGRGAVCVFEGEPEFSQLGINPFVLAYLNRLSDFLFIAARSANAAGGGDEPLWKPGG